MAPGLWGDEQAAHRTLGQQHCLRDTVVMGPCPQVFVHTHGRRSTNSQPLRVSCSPWG